MAAVRTDDDRLLLSRAYDAIELAAVRHRPMFLGFLNEHERMFLRDHLPCDADICWFGGYEDAVRVMLGASADEGDFPITTIAIRYPEAYPLTHRDVLGALMSLLITRESIGDILTEDGRAVVFVRDEVASTILSELRLIGRVGVTVSVGDPVDLPARADDDELTLTLPSLRLDAFVAALTGLSREKASRLIRSQLVAVDHVIELSGAKPLHPGHTITIRKYGKFVFTDDLGLTRKGRRRVAVRHFR